MRTIEDDIVVVQTHALWPMYWHGNEVRLLRNAYQSDLPQRGDFVVVQSPTSWMLRIILGLPHDIVDCDDRFSPEAIKINGLVSCNCRQNQYQIGKSLFLHLFGKLSFRIPDGQCLMVPSEAELYKMNYPFGLIPISSIIGQIESNPEEAPIGIFGPAQFDASKKMGLQLND
jgi:hypothetical protein